MIHYHPDAQVEFDAIFNSGIVGLKVCLGMAIQRTMRIDAGIEPLHPAELMGPGRQLSTLYCVSHNYGPFSEVEYIYEEFGGVVKVIAVGAYQGLMAFPLPTPGTARQRGHSRSS